ncbi:MAG: alpha/beta hydrolase [Clostridium sp.]|nr:alpha/beta hydrolase [Clostridium sp.]
MIFIKRKNIFRRVIIVILVLLMSITGVFIIWANDTYVSLEILSGSDSIEVENGDYIVFKPKEVEPTRGIIFYPGAKVEPEAYVKLCSKIAQEGYLVIIAPMTLNFAIFSPNKAENIIDKYTNIENWTMSGHSLGGVMAANYALKDSRVDSIIFYASYPQGNGLKDSNLKTLSIYASNDGIAKLERVKDAVLPEQSEIVTIQGGNHAGFGTYGEQTGDNKADISNDEEINIATEYAVKFLKSL